MTQPHPDDEFHPSPDPNDPEWTETCWFTFTVPERKLSGQLYPFFKQTLGVYAGGAYFWDDTGDQIWNCLYAKNFWHLPIPDGQLSDLTLANGASYKVIEPQHKYEIGYVDPDGGDEVSMHLTFTATAAPNYLGEAHLDQPGRYTGELTLHGETFGVDAFGFRDRSWGRRTQHGQGLTGSPAQHGGYSYATASEQDGFHAITMDFGSGAIVIHGYFIRDGVWAKLTEGKREVLERDAASGAPTRVRLTARDTEGRELEATGEMLNRLGFAINPNMWTWNCLTRWDFDGFSVFGEDHDNWSHPAQRRFAREHLAGRKPGF